MQSSKSELSKNYSVESIVADDSRCDQAEDKDTSQSPSYCNHGPFCGCYSCNRNFRVGFNRSSDDLSVLPAESVNSNLVATPNCILQDVQVHLVNREMWHAFSNLGTEMIITRIGRRLFPTLEISLSGLDSDGRYIIKADITAADNHRYKYIPASGWVPVQNGNHAVITSHNSNVSFGTYEHPDSPNTGKFWMKANSISFKKMKLSNDKSCKTKGCIILNSMRKYQPRIHIMRIDAPNLGSRIAVFPETRFFAVTSYQNVQVTKLKIQNNPFAKAFRDSNSQLTNCQSINSYTTNQLSKNLLSSFREHNINSYPTTGYTPGYSNSYSLDGNRNFNTINRNNHHFAIYPATSLTPQVTRVSEPTPYYAASTYSNFPSSNSNPYVGAGFTSEYPYDSPLCNHLPAQSSDSNRNLNFQLIPSRPGYHSYNVNPPIALPSPVTSMNYNKEMR
ncbi:T-box transcription factor TBX5-A [Trichoplax sp. H2]|nr:T-box transcription factor TBX5-A [Trichoplax sp. H2]|eukprot:RDD43444.1 T-box transcription factor TBX5-A [Trichoplax sp. H2]